jgi:hypothetical protein
MCIVDLSWSRGRNNSSSFYSPKAGAKMCDGYGEKTYHDSYDDDFEERELGRMKHKYCEDYLKAYKKKYGNWRGLSAEVRYCRGGLWEVGKHIDKNSVALDVVEGDISNPSRIFDYKFGRHGLTKKRIANIRRVTGFVDTPLWESRPGKGPFQVSP